MKKTMRFLSLAALALVGAVMTGCSNKDDVTVEPENKSNVVTLTTTVGLGDDATTRALAADGTKTFAAGETMAVLYNNGTSTVKAVSRPLEAGDIEDEGKSATFTFDLETPVKSGDVTYIYPAAMAGETDVDYSNLASQDGTLATLSSDLDLATYSGAWDGASLPSATLTNQLAFLAVTLKDADGSNDITSSITEMTISDGTNTYTVSPSSLSTIYVAIQPTTSANIDVTATDGSTDYTKSLTGKTYAAGNGYNVSWRMAPAPKAAAEATAEDKGKLIGTDGKIYADVAAATAAGTTAVAKIIYLGTTGHSTYTHGLALALTDEASKMEWQDAINACSAKNTSTPVTNATWLLASKDQWNYMLGTNGAGSYTALRDGFSSVGGSNLQSDESARYWSSTVFDSTQAWRIYFYNGIWNFDYKDDSRYVRACLAF